MAVITPTPRLGKTTGAAMPPSKPRKSTKRKPAPGVLRPTQPMARGLINR